MARKNRRLSLKSRFKNATLIAITVVAIVVFVSTSVCASVMNFKLSILFTASALWIVLFSKANHYDEDE